MVNIDFPWQLFYLTWIYPSFFCLKGLFWYVIRKVTGPTDQELCNFILGTAVTCDVIALRWNVKIFLYPCCCILPVVVTNGITSRYGGRSVPRRLLLSLPSVADPKTRQGSVSCLFVLSPFHHDNLPIQQCFDLSTFTSSGMQAHSNYTYALR